LLQIQPAEIKIMSTTLEYHHVFDLAQQLSTDERIRLIQELQSVGAAGDAPQQNESFLPDSNTPKLSPQEYYEFILQGPVLDEEDIQKMLDAKKEVDQCRPNPINKKHFENIDGLKFV
jgi:hypothetical protein